MTKSDSNSTTFSQGQAKTQDQAEILRQRQSFINCFVEIQRRLQTQCTAHKLSSNESRESV